MNVLSIFDDARKRQIEKYEKFRATRAAYLLKNCNYLKAWGIQYRQKHSDTLSARSRAYYAKNKVVVNAKAQEYRTKHRDAINACSRALHQKRKSVVEKPLPIKKPKSPAVKRAIYSPYRTPTGSYIF